MAREYNLLAVEEQESFLAGSHDPTPKRRSWLFWLPLAMLFFLSNVLSFIGGHYVRRQAVEKSPENSPAHSAPQAISLDKTHTRFWWNTTYSAADNATNTDLLWENIRPAHGFISVERNFASNEGWYESMYLPSDHSKGVYLLEAYHYLHCLKILRKTMWQAVEGQPYTHHPGTHMNHCFDALRQYVVCNADTTPLYTFGDFTAGDGQVRQCKNWTQLRQYATENTACYRDSVKRIPLGEHFGHCDNGDDGIIEL